MSDEKQAACHECGKADADCQCPNNPLAPSPSPSAAREAVEAAKWARDELRRRCHFKSGKCEYDEFGTGASGMAKQPCTEFRERDSWCFACRLKESGLDRALPILEGLVGERDALKIYEESWEDAAFYACAGVVPTPDKPSERPCRPAILHELRVVVESQKQELIDRFDKIVEMEETETELRSKLSEVERERDEARAFGEEACEKHNALLESGRVLRCAFCDEEYPPGTPPTQHDALTEHVWKCEKHPLRSALTAAEEERDKAQHSARQFCGAHIGKSFAECPVCTSIDRHDQLLERDEREDALVRDLAAAEARAEEAERDRRSLAKLHVLVQDAANTLREYPPDTVLGGNGTDAIAALCSAYDEFQCWDAMREVGVAVIQEDKERGEKARPFARQAIKLMRERDAALSRESALRERVGRLKAMLHAIPSLECPCCGEDGAFAVAFHDGEPTVCGCGGSVMLGDEPYIVLPEDECPRCSPTGEAEEQWCHCGILVSEHTQADNHSAVPMEPPTFEESGS